MICTRCEGYGFINLHQIADDVDTTDVGNILDWLYENEAHRGTQHDVQVCDCCGDGHQWYGEPGHHDENTPGVPECI